MYLWEDYLILFQGIKDEATTLPESLTKLFSKDVLVKLGMDARRCKIHTKKFDDLLENGVKVDLFLVHIICTIVKIPFIRLFRCVFLTKPNVFPLKNIKSDLGKCCFRTNYTV